MISFTQFSNHCYKRKVAYGGVVLYGKVTFCFERLIPYWQRARSQGGFAGRRAAFWAGWRQVEKAEKNGKNSVCYLGSCLL